ncbi:MAG: PepSY-associated TM helix domain-containing protein [Polyangiaceae bacterium]
MTSERDASDENPTSERDASDVGAAARAASKTPTRSKLRWRPWLRALHRDAGYLAVGLTLVYALSGLAVNHIADWDPNFKNYEVTHQLSGALSADDDEAASQALQQLKISEEPVEVFRVDDQTLDVVLDKRTLHINTQTGTVLDQGQKPRALLRAANWLHLNRGKKAWTYVADTYAVALLGLALSGLFMIPGRKGLLGRGAVLVGLGVAIPVLYVVLSGGP